MFYFLYKDGPRSGEKKKTFCRPLEWKAEASFHRRKWGDPFTLNCPKNARVLAE